MTQPLFVRLFFILSHFYSFSKFDSLKIGKKLSKMKDELVFHLLACNSIARKYISSIFWSTHRYLWSIRFIPHSFWDICEGSEFFSHTFVYLCVYRHANLCSGLRAILSPQFIKKNLQFWAYFQGSGTTQIRTRSPLGLQGFEFGSDALLTTPWASDEKCGYCGSALYNFNVCNKFKRSFKASALF